MSNTQFAKIILDETKGLPVEALTEVVDFIQFMKHKFLSKKNPLDATNNLSAELFRLNQNELLHLEEEFKNYKKLYPYE